VKKKIFYTIIFYFVLIIGYIVFAVLMSKVYESVSMQVDLQEKNRCVIIDPGHGGEDSGAVSLNGVFEKDINLNVSRFLKNMMKVSGFKVIMTRDTDVSIHDKSSKTYRKKKSSDLHNRLKLIKDTGGTLISVHQNFFPNCADCCGAEVIYSKNNPKSKELAECIKKSITSMIQPENKRPLKKSGEKIFLLHNTKIPAVLVECGFISNLQEEKKMIDVNYQKQMAFCIYCGFLEYFKK